jgi:hypothetical protein
LDRYWYIKASRDAEQYCIEQLVEYKNRLNPVKKVLQILLPSDQMIREAKTGAASMKLTATRKTLIQHGFPRHLL